MLTHTISHHTHVLFQICVYPSPSQKFPNTPIKRLYQFLSLSTLYYTSLFFMFLSTLKIMLHIFVWYSSVSISTVSIFILICHSLYGIQAIFLIYKWLTNLSHIFIFTWGGDKKKPFLAKRKWLIHRNDSWTKINLFASIVYLSFVSHSFSALKFWVQKTTKHIP